MVVGSPRRGDIHFTGRGSRGCARLRLAPPRAIAGRPVGATNTRRLSAGPRPGTVGDMNTTAVRVAFTLLGLAAILTAVPAAPADEPRPDAVLNGLKKFFADTA